MSQNTSKASGWSFQVGSAMGIPIRIHFTFLLLVVWFGFVGSRGGYNPLLSIAFLLLVFFCVVLHELGHAAMARYFGVRTRDIVLYPIGGIARLENIPAGLAELWIALAGPAVNLVLAGLLLVPAGLLLLARGNPAAVPELRTAGDLVLMLLVANIVLFLFNLIPAFPMDGGRVLRAALTLAMSPQRATEIAAAVGQGIAILLFGVGIIGSNVLLMLVALLVFLGASQEVFLHRQQAIVRGRTAREAMITHFEALAPQDSLERAAAQLLATHQHDFPVLDAWGRVVGILPRERLLEGLAQSGGSTAVLEVMLRDVPSVPPDAGLDQVLERLRANPRCPVLVLEDTTLVGMITLENLTEYIEVARRGSAPSARE